MSEEIVANLAQVRERISEAAHRVGRSPDEVTLVAVAKTRSPAEILSAYRAGVRHFGENRVEEAEEKRPQLDLEDVMWHMVGHLQRRRARRAIDLFDVLHSVDSVRLAHRLERVAAESEKVLRILVEVNVSGEESKYGFALADRVGLVAAVEEMVALPHLLIEGLMTVAFIAADPEQVRPVFAGLRELRDELSARLPQASWRHLSMGMTDDFEVAIEEGTTMVRIGRAIFGPADYAAAS